MARASNHDAIYNADMTKNNPLPEFKLYEHNTSMNDLAEIEDSFCVISRTSIAEPQNNHNQLEQVHNDYDTLTSIMSGHTIENNLKELLDENLRLKKVLQHKDDTIQEQSNAITLWQQQIKELCDNNKKKLLETKAFISELQNENNELQKNLRKNQYFDSLKESSAILASIVKLHSNLVNLPIYDSKEFEDGVEEKCIILNDVPGVESEFRKLKRSQSIHETTLNQQLQEENEELETWSQCPINLLHAQKTGKKNKKDFNHLINEVDDLQKRLDKYEQSVFPLIDAESFLKKKEQSQVSQALEDAPLPEKCFSSQGRQQIQECSCLSADTLDKMCSLKAKESLEFEQIAMQEKNQSENDRENLQLEKEHLNRHKGKSKIESDAMCLEERNIMGQSLQLLVGGKNSVQEKTLMLNKYKRQCDEISRENEYLKFRLAEVKSENLFLRIDSKKLDEYVGIKRNQIENDRENILLKKKHLSEDKEILKIESDPIYLEEKNIKEKSWQLSSAVKNLVQEKILMQDKNKMLENQEIQINELQRKFDEISKECEILKFRLAEVESENLALKLNSDNLEGYEDIIKLYREKLITREVEQDEILQSKCKMLENQEIHLQEMQRKFDEISRENENLTFCLTEVKSENLALKIHSENLQEYEETVQLYREQLIICENELSELRKLKDL